MRKTHVKTQREVATSLPVLSFSIVGVVIVISFSASQSLRAQAFLFFTKLGNSPAEALKRGRSFLLALSGGTIARFHHLNHKTLR